MKWKIYTLQLCVALTAILLAFSGCLKDHCTRTYQIYKPVYKTLSQVRANMKSSAPRALKATGKLYTYGNYIFLNEPDKGIHVIDNTNPSTPKAISFIPIPGNADIAVKDNVLYADSYSDLVTFDITNPQQVAAKSFQGNVFPEFNRYYYGYGMSMNPDSVQIIEDWIVKDTTVSCETYNYLYNTYYSSLSSDASGNFSATRSGGGTGQGGSMARFTIAGNHLYTVSYSKLNTFSLANAQQPEKLSEQSINGGIETIFPFNNKLFIGSTSGMFIFDISTPDNAYKLGTFSHVRSCDPVIADDHYAYVTLRSGTACQGFTNQLEVLDISNLTNPTLIKTYPMTNPHGLAMDDHILLICDGKDGLKLYDASHPNDLKLMKTIGGMETYDVIAGNKRALVVTKDGLYQFNYSDVQNVKLLSKISINQ